MKFSEESKTLINEQCNSFLPFLLFLTRATVGLGFGFPKLSLNKVPGAREGESFTPH